ncbi:MAG: hypothetical protein G01um101466_425 [Parcubacteria group bacterium Gr01-1014_66]|nr:MAG: hypothetical protein G01um101466_425 [Parcubacteria group bacterium Gr01-1014_66]
MVRLVAHLIFDGEIRRGACVYSNRNRVLIEYVRDDLQLLYQYPPKEESRGGVIRISYFNVALAGYLQEKAAAFM